MFSALTYNCNPESLGDVTREAFTEAFTSAVHGREDTQETTVTVTFDEGRRSGLVGISTDTDEEWQTAQEYAADHVERIAEEAFNRCC